MYRAGLRKITWFALLFLMSIVFLQFAWLVSSEKNNIIPKSEKVNLALRRCAHRMLAEGGDSTTQVSPITQSAENTWRLRLEQGFNYDRLPALLQESFEVYGIMSDYDVAIMRCTDDTVQLGYNFMDFSSNKVAACMGRDFEGGCYKIDVIFPLKQKRGASLPLAGWFLSGMMAALAYAALRKWRGSGETPAPDPVADEFVIIGQSRFDAGNQVLLCGGVRHELTYREAKLLQLFVSHPNQLLDRGFILRHVWADEGILVSRSVDMFVSRLRKLLRDDPSLRLAAVHGIGYRLEVESFS